MQRRWRTFANPANPSLKDFLRRLPRIRESDVHRNSLVARQPVHDGQFLRRLDGTKERAQHHHKFAGAVVELGISGGTQRASSSRCLDGSKNFSRVNDPFHPHPASPDTHIAPPESWRDVGSSCSTEPRPASKFGSTKHNPHAASSRPRSHLEARKRNRP